jgi:hypothetical protein
MWYAFWCAFQSVFYSFIICINVAWVIHFNMTMVRGKIESESDISDKGPITIARPSGVTVAPTGIDILSPLPACRSVFRIVIVIRKSHTTKIQYSHARASSET